MKILSGVCVALFLALSLTGWQLKQSWSATAEARERLVGVSAALKVSNEQNEGLLARLGAFDAALGRLNKTLNVNQTDLANRLDHIKNIAEEPTDDPESLACLDLPVPVQLDHGLREPTNASR